VLPEMVQRSRGKGKKGSTSFCEQKEAKKLFDLGHGVGHRQRPHTTAKGIKIFRPGTTHAATAAPHANARGAKVFWFFF
jgi:hypothetical protein